MAPESQKVEEVATSNDLIFFQAIDRSQFNFWGRNLFPRQSGCVNPRNLTNWYQKWPYYAIFKRSYLFQGPSFWVSMLVFGDVIWFYKKIEKSMVWLLMDRFEEGVGCRKGIERGCFGIWFYLASWVVAWKRALKFVWFKCSRAWDVESAVSLQRPRAVHAKVSITKGLHFLVV